MRFKDFLYEKAPPGKEEWIKANKARFKKRYGKDYKKFLYGHAWNMTNEQTGWLWDKDHITVYHGTHKRHVESIKKNGLNKPDPKTGMISVAPDPHTAHGYAAMSGETDFRAAGSKAKHVPHEDRRVVKMRIPKTWAQKHMDQNLSGNIGNARERMKSKDAYSKWKKENPHLHDHEYYQTAELRFKKPIPPEFIEKVGRLKKYAK